MIKCRNNRQRASYPSPQVVIVGGGGGVVVVVRWGEAGGAYACQTGLAVPGELKSMDAMWNIAANVDGGVSNREAKRAYRPTLHMHSHKFRQIGSRKRPPASGKMSVR